MIGRLLELLGQGVSLLILGLWGWITSLYDGLNAVADLLLDGLRSVIISQSAIFAERTGWTWAACAPEGCFTTQALAPALLAFFLWIFLMRGLALLGRILTHDVTRILLYAATLFGVALAVFLAVFDFEEQLVTRGTALGDWFFELIGAAFGP